MKASKIVYKPVGVAMGALSGAPGRRIVQADLKEARAR